MDSLTEENVIDNTDDNNSMIEFNIEEEKGLGEKSTDGKEGCETKVLPPGSEVMIKPEEESIEIHQGEKDTIDIQPTEEETVDIQPTEEETNDIQPKDDDTIEIQPKDDDTIEIKTNEEETVDKEANEEETVEIQAKDEETVEIQPKDEETVDLMKEHNDSNKIDKEKLDTEQKAVMPSLTYQSITAPPDVNTVPVKTIINELNSVDNEPTITNNQAKTRRPRRSRALTMKDNHLPSKPVVQKAARRTQRGGHQTNITNNLNRKSRFKKRTENLISLK